MISGKWENSSRQRLCMEIILCSSSAGLAKKSNWITMFPFVNGVVFLIDNEMQRTLIQFFLVFILRYE